MQHGGETYDDTSCDIVVIGAGRAGLSAAIQAASMGAHVIVLEKQGIIGGNTKLLIPGRVITTTRWLVGISSIIRHWSKL